MAGFLDPPPGKVFRFEGHRSGDSKDGGQRLGITDTITENHNESRCRVMELSPNTRSTSAAKALGTCARGDRKIVKRQRFKEFVGIIVCNQWAQCENKSPSLFQIC